MATTWRILTVTLLAAFGAHHYLTVRPPVGAEHYFARIRDTADHLPRQIGSWIGQDIPMPPQAVSTLKPNMAISRNYTNVETGAVAGFLLIHCQDAHHMVGHFPSRCYPSQGWTPVSSQPRDWVADDFHMTGTEYVFEKDELGIESSSQTVVVANCLFRPGHQVLRDINGLVRSIVGARGTGTGAAQLQIYYDSSVPKEQRDAAIVSLLRGCRPAIDAILADATD
ncbi:MAG TPA: exosortase-associated EpsI family protein [Tepidisphaeraceae bacterium]|nr:exosortase-associated EpsI family protein [Tepidisphaeraceae bacterium]